MRNVEALDADGQFRQSKRVLKRFLDGFRIRFHDSKALIIGLLGIGASKIDERTLVSALGYKDVDAGAAGILDLVGQQFFEHLAIFKFDRHINISRYVGLTDVELLEQRRKKLTGME